MGISGLLPLLKPIHKNKHLSEFAGKTIAVDAYVWLHKGVYACAPEVATGKRTTKYVEYSMHRVRLLRHHKIIPYIVFDGGPLPAKKGTESERKKRRDENLVQANKLAAVGKHAQAREYYVKCVDVTTEMAYQFIKALRAEGIQYVVAPYEADAQLAYLERVGIVDGILTEDSDLLVFGCQNVLFKLDSAAATVTSISRSDFGSVTAAEGGISLIGWSDVQFRAMAILSGCDYLPSIPGVGLKTAWSLLRKYKTVEKVIRAVMLEGKKEVPPDYLNSFRVVDKVFLHQRVYDPRTERLVHLIELPDGENLDGEMRESVGRELEPSLAKRVATGEICPISLLPIVDINPSYVPRMLKPLPLLLNGCAPVTSERSMMKQAAPKTTLHDFFQPNPKTPTPGPSGGRQIQSSGKKLMTTAGQASGKRTLSDALEMDANAKKRRKSNENHEPREEERVVTSKFFSGPRKTSPRAGQVAGGPSGTVLGMTKRSGVVEMIDLTLDGDESEPRDTGQEDGYISPTRSSYRFETPEVSTPHRHPRRSKSGVEQEDDDDFDAELLSSPVEGRRHRGKTSKRKDEVDLDRKELEWTIKGDDIDSWDDGPDLCGSFQDVDELPSDIDCPGPGSSFASTATTSSAGPITPNHSTSVDDVEDFPEEIEDDKTRIARTGSISEGWVKRWSYNGFEMKKTPIRRTETTATGDSGRRASYQKRSEAKVDVRSSGIRPIPKKRAGTELKGHPEDEIGGGDDISDHDEQRGSQEAAWPGGRRALR